MTSINIIAHNLVVIHKTRSQKPEENRSILNQNYSNFMFTNTKVAPDPRRAVVILGALATLGGLIIASSLTAIAQEMDSEMEVAVENDEMPEEIEDEMEEMPIPEEAMDNGLENPEIAESGMSPTMAMEKFNPYNRFLRLRSDNGQVFRVMEDMPMMGQPVTLQSNNPDTLGMKWGYNANEYKIMGLNDYCLGLSDSMLGATLQLANCDRVMVKWNFDEMGRLVGLLEDGTLGCVEAMSTGEMMTLELAACDTSTMQRFELEGTGQTKTFAQLEMLSEEMMDDEDDMDADMDGDGFVSVAEGVPFYGGIISSLTTEGDTSAASALALERYPVANEDGSYTYERTFTLDTEVPDLSDAHVVLHGIDIDNSGAYDGDKESSIAPGVPFEATVPAACGEIEMVAPGEYVSDVTQLNSSGTSATAQITRDGDEVSISFMATGISPALPHAQHFHLVTDGSDSICPPNTIGVLGMDDEGDADMDDEMGMNLAPMMSEMYAGASAVYLQEGMGKHLFVSSNTQDIIGVYDLEMDMPALSTFMAQGMDADGIYYDEDMDKLYHLNRTENRIDTYYNVKMNLEMGMMPDMGPSSTSDFTNGREIAVYEDKVIVAQDAADSNGNQNRLLIYQLQGEMLTLKEIFDVNINLWGIRAVDNDLFAIVDNSEKLAIFEDFFNRRGGDLQPNRIIPIEGIVRTHGLDYDEMTDTLVLTDVGEASSDSDGALSVIYNFTQKAQDNYVSLEEQKIIKGEATMLGNPVDVAYSGMEKTIYVAERANMGGQVLIYQLD